jgi:uncharacterized protein YcbK (DUF882 family)
MDRPVARSATWLCVACSVWLLTAATGHAQRQHTVRAGHSMARIAKHYGVAVYDLAAHNRMRPNDTIQPGQVLTIPPRGVIYVQPGWSLHKAARTHKVSVQALARANRMKPSSPLRAGQRLVLPGHQATARAKKRDFGKPDAMGRVKLRTRDDHAEVLLRDAEGNVPREGLQALGRLMHRGELDDDTPVKLPEPRLALLIAALSDHFGGREIHIVSGYRKAGGRTGRGSRHVHRAAVDIQVKGVSKRAVWDYCRSLRQTGCGFYPRSVFVHVDVRDHEAQWVDWSRPGQRSRYGTLRGIYGRNVPKHQRRPVTRKVSRPDEVPLEAAVVDEPVLADVDGDGDPTS